MALNKLSLENDLNKIFDADGSPPESISETAGLITDAIIAYLKNVDLEPLKAPGINPAPVPTPDPSFIPQPMKTLVPVDAASSILRSAIEADLNLNYNTNQAGLWIASNVAFASYVASTFVSFNTNDGYIATGATIPGPIALSSVFNPLKEEKKALASDLANYIHDFFTNCVFTGAYLKGPFIGPAPHVAKLF
jgi:hypothetical protein